MTPGARIPSAEVVPLAERMRYMLAFRFILVPVVALVTYLSRESLETTVSAIALATVVYLAQSVIGHIAWRASKRGGLWLFTGMLLADGVYLAWTSYATGGGLSPLRYLIILHIICVALLASYRTGLKMALWHSLLLLVVYYAQEGGLLNPLPQTDATGLGTPLEQLVAFSIVFWVVAIATSTFSAINERELRRRRYDLEALAAMAVRLENQSDSASVAETLLDCIVDAFDFERTLFFAQKEEGELTLLAHTGAVARGVFGPPPDTGSVIQAAMENRKTQLISDADIDNDIWLSVLVSDARNLVIVPLSAEGHAIGAIVAEHGMRRGSRIERRVLGMMERFASHGALALRNAYLLEQVQELAATDGLTGVANRYTFQHDLEREIERAARAGDDVALAMLDIDHFKRLNDAYGHQAGDEVLRRVAKQLSDSSRPYDTVARYGGEEFALVLPTTDRAEAREIVERLRREIAAASGKPRVTISAGLALFPTDATNADELVAAADEALYESKRAGRNRVKSSARHLKATQMPSSMNPFTEPPPAMA
jgi:two-component system, cell cycle response regulator